MPPFSRLQLPIATEHIELCKALKALNLVASGGEAKLAISEGMVQVDGRIETRKRKKLVPGSIVDFQGKNIEIVHKNKE